MKKIITLVACLSAAMVLSGCEVKAMLDDLNKDTAELKYDRATSRSKLLELGEKQGFLIAYDYLSSEGDKGTAKVGNKDGFFWIFNDVKEGENVESFGKAAEAKNDSYVAYDYNEEGNKFEATETIEKEAFDAVIETGVSWLLYAHSVDSALVEDGKDTVLGRECTKYKFKYTSSAVIAGKNAEINLSVDDELGITLKAKVSGMDENNASASVDFEVKSFAIGDAVVLPIFENAL